MINLESDYKLFLINEETSDIFAAFSLISISEAGDMELTNGLADRFQIIKYLRPRSVVDVTEADKDKLPSLKLVFDVETHHLESKELLSLCKESPKTLGRLEMSNLVNGSIDIKILPSIKMAISISMKTEPKPQFVYVPNKMRDSNYSGLDLWGIKDQVLEVAPEPTDFY